MKIITLTQQEFQYHIQSSLLLYDVHKTPAGPLCVIGTSTGIFQAFFGDVPDVENYHKTTIIPHIGILVGTPFQLQVWQATAAIPAGKTLCYKDLAKVLDYPKAQRAVARALGQNPIAYFIPCHRVIGSNGRLTGYKWGLERKRDLLNAEKRSY